MFVDWAGPRQTLRCDKVVKRILFLPAASTFLFKRIDAVLLSCSYLRSPDSISVGSGVLLKSVGIFGKICKYKSGYKICSNSMFTSRDFLTSLTKAYN